MIVNKDNKPLDVIFDGTLPDQDEWKFQETGLLLLYNTVYKITRSPTISHNSAWGCSLNNINKQLVHKYIKRVNGLHWYEEQWTKYDFCGKCTRCCFVSKQYIYETQTWHNIIVISGLSDQIWTMYSTWKNIKSCSRLLYTVYSCWLDIKVVCFIITNWARFFMVM